MIDSLTECLAGTFGQPDTWDIYDSNTFQHPMVPYDVLVDPLSLPSHPVIQERENVLDILYGEPEDRSHTYDSGGEQVWINLIRSFVIKVYSTVTCFYLLISVLKVVFQFNVG